MKLVTGLTFALITLTSFLLMPAYSQATFWTICPENKEYQQHISVKSAEFVVNCPMFVGTPNTIGYDRNQHQVNLVVRRGSVNLVGKRTNELLATINADEGYIIHYAYYHGRRFDKKVNYSPGFLGVMVEIGTKIPVAP